MAAGEKIRNEDLGEIWKGNKKTEKNYIKTGEMAFKMQLFELSTPTPYPCRRNFIRWGKKSQRRGGGRIEMDNIYPWNLQNVKFAAFIFFVKFWFLDLSFVLIYLFIRYWSNFRK